MNHSGEVIERGRSQVDRSCYVWGAQGQDLNAQRDVESFVRSKESTTGDPETQAKNVRRVLQRYEKLRAKGYDPILCFDCSGFIYWLFSAFDLIRTRTNAAGLYKQCDDKDRGQLRAGDLVFVHNGSRITHVGLYAGDGNVIHCKGRDVGVIEEMISRHGWNRYGKFPGMYDEEPPEPGQVYVLTKGTVKIRTGPGTDYEAIGTSKKNEKFPWLSDDPRTGWHEIEYKGEPAWITGKKKYTEVISG